MCVGVTFEPSSNTHSWPRLFFLLNPLPILPQEPHAIVYMMHALHTQPHTGHTCQKTYWSISLRFSQTVKGAAVHSRSDSTVSPGAYSVSLRPLDSGSTSKTA